MSKARAKGTRGEVYFLPVLRDLFGDQVERAPLKGTLDYGDYTGVPWLHECKHTVKPSFMEWARVAKGKVAKKGEPSHQWTVVWKGDGRTADGQPLVTMPLAKYVELVRGQCF